MCFSYSTTAVVSNDAWGEKRYMSGLRRMELSHGGGGEAVERGNSKLNKTNFSIEFTEGGRKIINFHLRIFD